MNTTKPPLSVAMTILTMISACATLAVSSRAQERRYQFYNPTVEHVSIHEGKVAPGHYAYNHMVAVEWFDGQFHAVWGGNAATFFEGKPGQFNVWATSPDFKRWSGPMQLSHVGNAPLPVDPKVIEWQPNLLNYLDRQLWCVWFCRSEDPQLQGTYLSTLEKGAGDHWRHRKILNRREIDGLSCIAFVSQNPVLLASGRVLAPVTFYPVEKNHPGRFKRWNACLYTDDGGLTWEVSDLLSMVDDLAAQWEPFFYEQHDGRIRALMRNFTNATPPSDQWRLTAVGTGAAKGSPVRFPRDPGYSFMETVNERSQVFRLPGGRFCLVQHDGFTNHRDYRTRINVALNFSRSGADDFVAATPISRPGVISRYPQGVAHDGKLYIGYTLGPGDGGPGPELSGMEGAIVSPAPRADTYYVWPRSKELIQMTVQADAAGKKTVRRNNPGSRTARPQLATFEGRQAIEFRNRASAGVDIDTVNFETGGALELTFSARLKKLQDVGMAVLCSVGDRIPIRLGVPANRPGKLYAYTRNQWEPVGDFPPEQWHALRVVVDARSFTVAVNGQPPKTFPNPLVNPTPRVYLGDGFENDYVASNAGSEFAIDLGSIRSRALEQSTPAGTTR